MWLVLAALAGAPAAGWQAAAPAGPRFDAASVKKRVAGVSARVPTVRMLVTPGRISFSAVWLRDVITWAYGLADYQLTGPELIDRGLRWDIEAAAAGPATEDELRAMTRALLEERFKLRLARATRDTRVYVMTRVGAGRQLTPAAADAPRTDDRRMSPLFGRNRVVGAETVRTLSAQRATLTYFAEYLTRQLGIPVLDRSGLTGDFAFTLEWVSDTTAKEDAFGAAGIAAVRDQLGLALTAQTVPLEVFVVESVEEASDN